MKKWSFISQEKLLLV